MGKEYVDGSGAPVDYSRDQFQGCNHYGFSGTTSPVNGFPRTTEPHKTWLDEMAHDYAKIISEEFLKINRCTPLNLSNSANIISEHAYKLATAMLAEKIKREAEE